MLFSSLLTFRLREVLSVVDQFLNVSKVNTLCITQVCKCFHYNTGFSLAIYRAYPLPESRGQPHSAEPPEYLTHRHSLPTLQPGLLKAMTKQKYFTLGVGSAFCGSLNSGQSSDATSFTPPLFLSFWWHQQTEKWNTIGSMGTHKMHLQFSTISMRVPRTLVKTFTHLHFDD